MGSLSCSDELSDGLCHPRKFVRSNFDRLKGAVFINDIIYSMMECINLVMNIMSLKHSVSCFVSNISQDKIFALGGSSIQVKVSCNRPSISSD